MINKRIAVIGAGAAGLTCAWRLARWGFSVALFEATPRLGGALATLPATALRFPAAAPYLNQLIVRRVVTRSALEPLPLEAEGQKPPPWCRWPLAWLRLMRWGSRFPDQPLVHAPGLAGTFGHWLGEMAKRWSGQPLAEVTWRRFAPLAWRLSFPSRPFAWQVSEPAREWLAVALARAIGQMGHAVHIATPVTALGAEATGWTVHAAGLTPWHADAIVLAAPPPAAASLLPFSRWTNRLTSWPYRPIWGEMAPTPTAVAQPVAASPRCWLAGGWLAPEGAFPGLDAAVGSGWTTARAVRAALLAS